jgi:DNA-binding MarR family transcriptional regulator
MNDAQLKLSSQICFPLYSASRLITKAYKPYLDEMGLRIPYLVLLVLWENDGLYVNQITEKLLLSTNTLSPLLKRMEKMEFYNALVLLKMKEVLLCS